VPDKKTKLTRKELMDMLGALKPDTPVTTAPTLTQQDDNTVTIDWPSPKPTSFSIAADAFEALIEMINSRTRAVNAARTVFKQMGELGEQL
jgi:hypothetical protein